ncbi:DUF5711 family protein [uncultured Flavonifractor sp.]|uniref:DUF5711 family protein n=1 Tax=uncultured Flavonifractor sp. TaxID=1193534 RepID=UPI0025D66255|nr:DUF5711 family protein [uncultured Flavonifractor sp.]
MPRHIISNKAHRLNEDKNADSAPRKEKRPNIVLRLLAFLLTVVMVLGAIFLIVNYDKLNFDSIKRWFTYRNLERGDSGQAESFPFDGDGTSTFASLDGDLLVCSTTGVRLYSASGQVYVDRTVTMENPVAVAAGSTALAYDAGGQTLLACRNREEAFTLELAEDEKVLSADVNGRGWMVTVTQESGYKGVVTVYDDQFQPQMQVSLSSRFIMDAALSPDSGTVAVLTMGLTDGAFTSQVELYPTAGGGSDASPQATGTVGSQVILDMTWDDNGIWALGEDEVYHLDASAALTGSYSYSDRYLKGFSLAGDGTAVLLLGKYRAGSTADLVVVDAQGEARATLALDEQVLSISAAGRYISLLTADQLDIYDQDLSVYHSLEGTQSARKALQRSDGSVLLIGNDTARVYLPQ